MAELTRRWVVAVDGPSGSGKSTVSRAVAAALDADYLDTGAMYRAVTWAVLQAGVDLADPEGIAKVATDLRLEVGTDPEHPSVRVGQVAVDGPIRGPAVTAAVSAVAAVPAVRRLLVAQQREIIAGADRIVVEGRDIGTVVAPEAELKVFLTAAPDERARRRSVQDATDPAEVAADLARRDRIDATRAADPLQLAADAVELDTTGMDIDEVVAVLHARLQERE